jgi:hypothetical protein
VRRGNEGTRRGDGVGLGLTWYEHELRSLNLKQKMKAKMSQKMTIFAKARVGFDFSKMIIFGFILVSF